MTSTIKERPILFSGPMVRAILEGKKTVTRRAMKPQPELAGQLWELGKACWSVHAKSLTPVAGHSLAAACPFGQPGDRLWVRESHAQVFEMDIPEGRPAGPVGTAGSPGQPDWKSRYVYRADGEMPNVQWHHVGDSQAVRWTPSIHMPRPACRILLEVTAVRVERLQDISEDQSRAEGAAPAWLDADDNETVYAASAPTYRQGFAKLWRDINGDEAWGANPWVWVVEFKRVTP